MEAIAYEFQKGNNEIIRATISNFKGGKRADLRVYFLNKNGEWTPTKKGVSVHLDLLKELKKAVAKLEELSKA